MTLRLSQSEIATFMSCRRQWWLAYGRGLRMKQPDVAGAASLGTRVHRALRAYYDPNTQQDPLDNVSIGIAADAERIPARAEEIIKEGEYALAIVEGYLDWLAETGADADLTVVGAEEVVEVPLPSVPGVTLISQMDLRVYRERDNARLFMDHKIVGDLKTLPKTAHMALQFKHYCLIERLQLADDPTVWCNGGVYNMLRKSKRTARATPPFYARHDVHHNTEVLRTHYMQVTEVAREILRLRERLAAGEEPRYICNPNPTRDCSWKCDFLPICPMFDDGGDPEGVVRIAYDVGDPLGRYEDTEEEVE